MLSFRNTKLAILTCLALLPLLPFSLPQNRVPLVNPDGTSNYDAYMRQEYEDLLDLLTCIYVPIGALGFYMWVTTMILTSVSIHATAAKDEEKGLFGLVGSAAGIGYSIWGIITNGKTIGSCGDSGAFGAIRAATVVSLSAAIFNLVGSVVLFLYYIQKKESLVKPARIFFFISLAFQVVGGPAYFTAVGLTIDYLRPADYQASGVGYGVMFVVMLPPILLGLAFVVIVLSRTVKEKLGEAMGLHWGWLMVAILVLLLSLVFCAFGNVGMGKAVEDIWGKYIVKKAVGMTSAALTGIMPFLSAMLV